MSDGHGRRFSYSRLSGDEDDDAQLDVNVSRNELAEEIMETGQVEGYWGKLKGFQWLLGQIVQSVFRGKRPILLTLFTFLLAFGLGLISLLLYPVELNTSLSSFEIPDHLVYLRQDALEVAIGHRLSNERAHFRTRRAVEGTTFLDPGERKRDRWKIDLMYIAEDGGSIFRRDILGRIHEVERAIEHKEDYTRYCWMRDDVPRNTVFPGPLTYCVPLNSLLTYFYRWDGRNPNISYHGNITRSVHNAIALAKSRFLWYVDSSLDDPSSSHLLRAQIILGYPMHGRLSDSQQHAASKKYIISFVPFLEKLSSR